MKIVSVIGARPQFIKSAPVSSAIVKAGYQEYIIHTGQHYDYELSQIFFDELGLPEPSINLGIGSGSHAEQTGQMLIGVESALLHERPDIVLVYGDTNSTIAGALAAAKLQIRIAHIEAGLRSFNRSMPEEHNRVLTDHCSDLLFCPTKTAVTNLYNEGIRSGVHLVGDTMYDSILQFSPIAEEKSKILQILQVTEKNYLLLTIHRAYNTDIVTNLASILAAFASINEMVIFPAHPRTMAAIKAHQISLPENVKIIEPVGYLDMLALERHARVILTDSGGIQKEAYFLQVPCLTLRPETEWVETIESGWNIIVDSDTRQILEGIAMSNQVLDKPSYPYFGNGHAAEQIVQLLPEI